MVIWYMPNYHFLWRPPIFILCLIGFLGCTEIIARESSVGELRSKLNSPDYSDKDKAYFADTLLLYYRPVNIDSALYFVRKMMNYAGRYQDTASIDYGYTHLGSIFRASGDYDSSIHYYKVALQRYMKRNYDDGVASIYSNLANVYKLQSRYDLAIKNYLEAIAIFKNSKNPNALANAYSGLAGLYYKLDNIEKAFYYWKLSEGEYEKGEPKEQISHAYRGKARVYLRNKKFSEAKKELEKAIRTDSLSKNDICMAENLLLELEWALVHTKSLVNEQFFTANAAQLVRIIRASKMPVVEMRYHEFMGDFLFYKKDYKNALTHYDSSLNVIRKKEDDTPEIRLAILRKKFEIKLLMSPAADLIKDYHLLKEYQEEVAKIKNERITQETDARYSLKDKEEKIKILNEKNEAANALVEKEKELSEQNRKQILFLWIGIIAFIFFLIYVLITNRKLKSTQKELQKNIEQKDFLFRELNHRVKNNLHIVSSFLSIESHGKSEDITNILQTCENRIHSLGLVHEMLYKGEISENISVKSYFEKLVSVLKETLLKSDTQIQTIIDEQLYLTSNKMVLVGLIANELITNSVKYAQSPDRRLIITIECHKTEDRFTLLIADNGIGLHDNASNKDSLGMKLAKGLTRQLNGEFSFENKNEGVEFRVEF